MGNCIKKESSMQWGGDDWSDDYSDHLITGNPVKINLYSQSYTYKTIQEEDGGASTSEVKTEKSKQTTQVKLKITRKQLEELLKVESTTNMKGGGLLLEQVLAHLIHDDDQHSHHQHHSWQPHLPTITEL